MKPHLQEYIDEFNSGEFEDLLGFFGSMEQILKFFHKQNLLQYIGCFLGILFILLYIILINPTTIILLFPFTFTLILVNLVNIKNKKFILFEILCYLFLLAFFLYFGILFYFKGLYYN